MAPLLLMMIPNSKLSTVMISGLVSVRLRRVNPPPSIEPVKLALAASGVKGKFKKSMSLPMT